MASVGLEPSFFWLTDRRLRPLGHIHLLIKIGKKLLIHCFESYHQSLLKLQAKALILNDANHVYNRFWPLFLAFQRVLLKDRFHDFYKLFPIFYILPSYQNISETENNSDKHWLIFLEVFYNCFTIPRFQDNFYKKVCLSSIYTFPL